MKKGSNGKNVKKRRADSKQELSPQEKLPAAVRMKRKPDWIRLAKYRDNRLKGMNRFQAALEAGYAYTTARKQSHKIDRLAKIDILQALEDAGATNRKMAQELVRLATSAMKREHCTVEIRNEDGEIVVDEKAADWIPDEYLRKATWELIAKLKKQLSPAALIPERGFKRLVIVVENETDDNQSAGSSLQTHAAPKLRVETSDES